MIAPSTIASAGRGKTPNFRRRFSAPTALTWAILTELEPMSSPTISLLPNSPIDAPVIPPLSLVEHLVPVGQLQAQRQDDLALRVHAARHPLSLIHISEPTRLGMISYAVFCL